MRYEDEPIADPFTALEPDPRWSDEDFLLWQRTIEDEMDQQRLDSMRDEGVREGAQ